MMNEQETFWNGSFGDDYIARNLDSPETRAAYINRWAQILNCINQKIETSLEFGPNIGLNFHALKTLIPNIKLSGVEINSTAAGILKKIDNVTVYNQSVLDFDTDDKYDLVYSSGVLIHIDPEKLPAVYQKMYDMSSRYIVCCEYYSPNPVAIEYRGHKNKLFKRDFAGEIMELFPSLKLDGYGFVYHRDNFFPGGDSTWFVMEK